MKARLVAIVVVLTGQVTLAGAEPCPPSARLAGEPAAVERIASELAVLGVASQEIPARCPAVSAEVATRDEAIELTLRDPAGRVARRTVTDAVVAATVIESWARTDIGAPLLAARLLGVAARAAPPAVTIASRDRVEPPVRPEPRRAVYVSAHVERHYVADDSEWRALGIAGCARVDGLCLGGELRVADDHGFSHTGGVTEFQRVDGALLATADLPIAAGRTAIVPGIGVGIGWLQTSREEPAEPMCNPDGTCDERDASGAGVPIYVGDGRHRRTLGMRFAVRLATRLPIATRVWLDFGLAAEVSPNAEGEVDLVAEPGAEGPLPGTDDPGAGMAPPSPAPPDVYSLPADPSHQFRFGIGIGYGFE